MGIKIFVEVFNKILHAEAGSDEITNDFKLLFGKCVMNVIGKKVSRKGNGSTTISIGFRIDACIVMYLSV